MTIALLIPAERSLCPYVELYTSVLDLEGIRYIIIEWDRLHRNAKSGYRYRSNKMCAQMGIFDYIRYAKFIKMLLKNMQIDTAFVFGLPLLFALNTTGGLRNLRYGVDIRDHHKSYSLPFTKRAVAKTKFCAVSSPRYSTWLPRNIRPITSHNDHGLANKELSRSQIIRRSVHFGQRKIVVGTIGQLKDLSANKILLDQLGNNEKYEIVYHGEGVVDSELKAICQKRKIRNVQFTGRYQHHQEPDLYAQCDAISMLMTPGTVNNATLLANRVYNSALFGVPLIAFSGSYLSEVVDEYKLGIVIKNSKQLQRLDGLLEDFYNNIEEFDNGRLMLKKWVQEDNALFSASLLGFLQ